MTLSNHDVRMETMETRNICHDQGGRGICDEGKRSMGQMKWVTDRKQICGISACVRVNVYQSFTMELNSF